jgi:hypothetical protein
MTAPLLSLPIFRAFDSAGLPLAGGKLYAYLAGSTNNKVTWSDAAATVANTNPVVLDTTGSATVRLDPGFYDFVLTDSFGNVQWSEPEYESNYFTQSDLVAILNPRTPAEIAASVTPVNFTYNQGDPRRYGAVLDGVTDDTATLDNWAKVGGALTFPPLTALISSTITLVSDTTILATQGAEILTTAGGFNLFTGASISNVLISGFNFVNTAAGVSLQDIAHVHLHNCMFCTVRDCNFTGMQCCGVEFDGCGYCHADNNYFHNGLYFSGLQETCDIGLFGYNLGVAGTGSYSCTVTNNKCFGGGCFGIANQDEYTDNNPSKNLIQGNRIGGCIEYGILVYMPNATGYNSFTQVIGNYIENVQGSLPSNTTSGAGIYVVGAAAGGTVIQGNTITNCCINTTARGLAPAGIGISGQGAATGIAPIVVSGNVVNGMTQYDGILIIAAAGVVNAGGVSVTGNTVNMPAGNTTGYALHVEDSSYVVASDNILITQGAQSGVYIEATGVAINNITMRGNQVSGGGGTGTSQVLVTGAMALTSLIITDNQISGGGATGNAALTLANGVVAGASIANNIVTIATTKALSVNQCTGVRVSNNILYSTGTNAVTLASTCTGSFLDKTNLLTGTMVNSATGFHVDQFRAAAPSTGTAAKGDTVYNDFTATTTDTRFCCTVAGSPGTWAGYV